MQMSCFVKDNKGEITSKEKREGKSREETTRLEYNDAFIKYGTAGCPRPDVTRG